jgi:protein-disulfide isomerase
LTSRQERRRNQPKKTESTGHKNWLLWGGAIIVVIAVVFVVVFVMVAGFTTNGGDETGTSDESALVSGGSIIGDPNAPVTLVEFGDFQ